MASTKEELLSLVLDFESSRWCNRPQCDLFITHI
jgi:hypothetical protein